MRNPSAFQRTLHEMARFLLVLDPLQRPNIEQAIQKFNHLIDQLLSS
ncbi:MAG: hypothetical protein ACSNEK_06700 [Parachlamydiaceae bacterium]